MEMSSEELKDILKLAGIGHDPEMFKMNDECAPEEIELPVVIHELEDDAVDNMLLLDQEDEAEEEVREDVTDVDAMDYFPTGEHGPVTGAKGPASAKQGDNPMQSAMMQESSPAMLIDVEYRFKELKPEFAGVTPAGEMEFVLNCCDGAKAFIKVNEDNSGVARSYEAELEQDGEYDGHVVGHTLASLAKKLHKHYGISVPMYESDDEDDNEEVEDGDMEAKMLESKYLKEYREFLGKL